MNSRSLPQDAQYLREAQYLKSEQVARCGNAVCPPIPAALVRANLPELCKGAQTA